MNSPITKTDLYIGNTLNLPITVHNCTMRRPCYRLLHCVQCRKNHRGYLRLQTSAVSSKWGLDAMLTVTITSFAGDFKRGLSEILNVRKALSRLIGRQTSSIAFTVVAANSQKPNCWVPHIHYLVSGNHVDRVKSFLCRKFGNLKFAVHNLIADPIKGGIVGLVSYCLDQNYYPLLFQRPRRVRLITASRGYRTGRPDRQTTNAAKLSLKKSGGIV